MPRDDPKSGIMRAFNDCAGSGVVCDVWRCGLDMAKSRRF